MAGGARAGTLGLEGHAPAGWQQGTSACSLWGRVASHAALHLARCAGASHTSPFLSPAARHPQARILVHGKVTHLGYYETEEEAARVYDK